MGVWRLAKRSIRVGVVLIAGWCLACAAPEPDRPSVLVLELDGADWSVLDPLMGAGLLPNLRAQVEAGVRARLDCVPAQPGFPCFCPPVWAAMATGFPSTEHGIRDSLQPYTDRKLPAVWSVLHEHGGTSTGVSIRNVWPGDPGVHFSLTERGLDHASFEKFERWPAEREVEDPGPPEHWTRPSGLLETLGLLPHRGERPQAWAMLSRDRVAMQGLTQLARRHPTDLSMILIHSTDKTQHMTWGSIQKGPKAPIDEKALIEIAKRYDTPITGPPPATYGTVASQFLEVDAWLGELLAEVSFDYFVLASDHGMARRAGPGYPGDHGPKTPRAHRGVLAIRGPGVRAGVALPTVSVLDFAPTLAYLLELPVGADLPGHVLTEAFEPEHLAAHPIVSVPSWGTVTATE